MKNSIDLSLPASRTVRGYEIKKMPLGVFLKAVRLLQDAPGKLAEDLYPGEGVEGLLQRMKALDRAGMERLISRALCVLPEKAVLLFSFLSGISEEKLWNDSAVGLDGIAEMMLAWVEVNGIENFIQAAGALGVKVRNLTKENGYSG